MEQNEQLRSPEFISNIPEKRERPETYLTPEAAQRTFVQRREMFTQIESSLSISLREALPIKIEHEKKELLKMLDADVLAKEAEKKRNKVLDFTYFKKKTLNTNNL
jgi:hypothetical protein